MARRVTPGQLTPLVSAYTAVALNGTMEYLFHTVLGMFAVRTHLYDQRLDILQRCRTPHTSRT